jgi:hypothetical protein
MNLEDTIREALQSDAAELVPVGPGPDDARRRAHRRRRRMQAGVVSVSAVALVGASLAIVDSRSSGHGPRVQAQPVTSQPTPDLAWRSVDGTVGYDTAHFTTSDGVTYALSTAPGATQSGSGVMPQELYATHNGIDWTHTSLGPAPWVTNLTGRDGVLYALGTAPGQRATTYKLSTSSDGGANWDDDTSLPVSFTPPSASVTLTPSTSAKVARGAHTTVVIATATYTPDISGALGGKAWIASDSGGVQIIDAQACKLAREGGIDGAATSGDSPCTKATETKPWSDFGISDPAALHQQAAVVRDDGGSWQTVPLASGPGTWVQDVAATSNGFLMAESDASVGKVSERLLSSPDGRAWTPLVSVPPIDQVSISGDRVIGMNSPSGTLYTSNDAGATWSAGTAVSSLVGGSSSPAPFAMFDVGPLGFAVVAQAGAPASPTTVAPGDAVASDGTKASGPPYLLYSTDGSDWKKTDLAAVGAPSHGSYSSMNVGADHIDVTYTDPVYGAGTTPTSWKLTTLVGTPKA